MIIRCFWELHWEILALLKIKGGCDTSFNFQLKIISGTCLLGSVLKLIFHWNVQILTFIKWLFSSFAEVLMTCTTVKRDVSSPNNFVLEDESSDKSFTSINSNDGPRMEPCETPALTFSHVNFWPSKSQIKYLAGYQIYHFVTVQKLVLIKGFRNI